MKTNPNGANQHTLDPRQKLCWDFYLESIAKGSPNAKQSAIKAGYNKTSAQTITVTSWFKARESKLKRKELVDKGEKVLKKTLDYKTEDNEGKVDTNLLRVQTDVAKYVTSTLGKNRGYSTKEEEQSQNNVLINIEKQIINLLNDNPKTIDVQSRTIDEVPEVSGDIVQKREGRASDNDSDSVRDVRDDILKALSED